MIATNTTPIEQAAHEIALGIADLADRRKRKFEPGQREQAQGRRGGDIAERRRRLVDRLDRLALREQQSTAMVITASSGNSRISTVTSVNSPTIRTPRKLSARMASIDPKAIHRSWPAKRRKYPPERGGDGEADRRECRSTLRTTSSR